MLATSTLPSQHWQLLVSRFGREAGCCTFDVPGQTSQPAPFSLLTALPAQQWSADDGQELFDRLDGITPFPEAPSAAGPTEADYWLPLRLGFVAYQDGDQMLGLSQRPGSPLPAITLREHDWVMVLDRARDQISVLFHSLCPESRQTRVREIINDSLRTENGDPEQPFRLTGPFRPGQSKVDYMAALQAIDDYIHAGDVYQVNYAQQYSARYTGHPVAAYLALYDASPSACAAYLDTGQSQILSLSPERFLRVQNRWVETRPIKGTRRRGLTPEDDQAMARELLNSPKDRAENLMIVDLLRNDLGKCCETGSIEAHPLFALESFVNVHHLVSAVRGRLRTDLTPLDLLLSAFPGGSITGAPKRRAMEIIRELEPVPRGAYCGSFFHWTPGNGFDSTIAIRTLECHDGVIDCKGGGGIVADSEPEEEYEESLTKIRFFMGVLEGL